MQKSSAKKSSAKTAPVAEVGEADNVDKIRDILFGNQMREFERKFSQLEQRISDDINSLKKDNAMQIESLQSYIDSEVSILDGKLKASDDDNHEQMDKLAADIDKNHKQAEKKLAALSKTVEDQGRDINQKMLKQSQDFQAEMNSQFEMVRKRMDEYREDLSNGKVDKSALAEMLNALALQVQGEDSQ